jgi:hypothetical protein
MKKHITNITVYTYHNFEYIRISDVKDDKTKQSLMEFMGGQTMPLIESGDTFITDAVYLWDYENFLNKMKGKPHFFD